MGVCVSHERLRAEENHRRIERQLVQERTVRSRHVKLLLLGSGECGKSTILKQMKILHNNGFTADEVLTQAAAIYSNTVVSMSQLLHGMHTLGIQLHTRSNEKYARLILDRVAANENSEPIDRNTKEAIQHLWADAGVKEAFARRAEFQVLDAANFFENVERIATVDYRPTELDILNARVRTTGVNETQFVVKALIFRVFDVGGQRTERRKWIHCFDDANGIIFISAVNEYDQTLVEDCRVNRLRESLHLFESICNSVWFSETSMILFLNKIDLFKEKIGRVPLSVCFKTENFASRDYDECMTFIEERFLALNAQEQKQVFLHRTCATDTNQVQLVLENVLDMLIQNNVHGCGLT